MTADFALAPPYRSQPNWPLLLGLLLAAAIVLPTVAVLVWTPSTGLTGPTLAEPDATWLLGTDPAGRDLVSTLTASALSSLLLAGVTALVVMLLALPAAVLLALWLKHDGPAIGVLSLPAPVLAIGLVLAGLGAQGYLAVILGIVLPGLVAIAPAVARSMRELWRKDYVASARIAGLSALAAAQRHVLPRLLPELLATGLELAAAALIVEVTLTFAGLGVPPSGASLGLLLRDGQQFLALRPLLVIAPGLVTVLAALALLLVAAGLRRGRP